MSDRIREALEAARQDLLDWMASFPKSRPSDDVIDKIDAALRQLDEAEPVALTDDAIAARCSQLESVRALPRRVDEDLWPHVERAMLDIARLYAAPPAQDAESRPMTYRSQPGNVACWEIGEACRHAADDPKCGDYIDRGLVLLRELQQRGYGIVRVESDAARGERNE